MIKIKKVKFKCILGKIKELFDLIAFDLDGTLIDSSPGIFRCFNLGLVAAGREACAPSELRRVIGPPLRLSYGEFFGLNDEEIQVAISAYRAEYFVRGCLEGELYPGMMDTLKSLFDAGYRLCMATSKPEVMAKKMAGAFGFDQYFTAICGGGLDGHDDKPTLISRALAAADVTDPARACMVGDRLFDMQGAKTVGTYAIGVLYGFGSRRELEQAGADAIAETAMDISKIIRQKRE